MPHSSRDKAEVLVSNTRSGPENKQQRLAPLMSLEQCRLLCNYNPAGISADHSVRSRPGKDLHVAAVLGRCLNSPDAVKVRALTFRCFVTRRIVISRLRGRETR